MDANERWRRASESADRFSPFRRRPPVLVGLRTALVASISLAIFLGVAGLDIGQLWIAALVSVAAMMLAGSCFTLLSNHKAKSSYISEYRRLNKINPVSDRSLRESATTLPIAGSKSDCTRARVRCHRNSTNVV